MKMKFGPTLVFVVTASASSVGHATPGGLNAQGATTTARAGLAITATGERHREAAERLAVPLDLHPARHDPAHSLTVAPGARQVPRQFVSGILAIVAGWTATAMAWAANEGRGQAISRPDPTPRGIQPSSIVQGIGRKTDRSRRYVWDEPLTGGVSSFHRRDQRHSPSLG